MRPTLVLGFLAALAAAVTIDSSVRADPAPPPPTFAVSSTGITATAQGGTHLNASFPWSFKDTTGTKVKTAVFTFPPDPAPSVTITNIAPAPGTALRGGFCLATGCYTFTASCTASSCTVTGT